MGHNPTVLVIEDLEELRDVYRLALEEAGFAVASARDARGALEQLRGAYPVLILIDTTLLESSELDLLTAIRATPALRTAPVVLVSSDLRGERAQGERLGEGEGCTLRPLPTPDELPAVVRRLVNGAVPESLDATLSPRPRARRPRA